MEDLESKILRWKELKEKKEKLEEKYKEVINEINSAYDKIYDRASKIVEGVNALNESGMQKKFSDYTTIRFGETTSDKINAILGFEALLTLDNLDYLIKETGVNITSKTLRPRLETYFEINGFSFANEESVSNMLPGYSAQYVRNQAEIINKIIDAQIITEVNFGIKLRKIIDARDLISEYNEVEREIDKIESELSVRDLLNYITTYELGNQEYSNTENNKSKSAPMEISFLLNPEEVIFGLIKSKVTQYENESLAVNVSYVSEDNTIRSYNTVAEQASNKNASLFKSIVKATDSAYIPTYNEDTAIAAIYLFKAGYNKNEVINLLKEKKVRGRYNIPISPDINVIENVERSLDNYNFKLTTKFKRD